MELKNYEFYRTPQGDVMIKEGDSPVFEYEQKHRRFTSEMCDHIKTFYPAAFKALAETYSRVNFSRGIFEYRMVHRFIRCNFGEYDQEQDIDHNGAFRLENVSCPLVGECKHHNIICNAKFSSSLSARELEIMKLFYFSNTPEAIADKLFISIDTVKTHRRNALKRLGMHSTKEFVAYAARHKMFEK